MKSYIYRNLHKDCWSVSDGRKVLYHARALELREVTFKVRKGGRANVLRTNCKNVHAFVVGEVELSVTVSRAGGVEVTYNPYKNESFVRVDTGEAVCGAERVLMECVDGKAKVWAFVIRKGDIEDKQGVCCETVARSDRHEV